MPEWAARQLLHPEERRGREGKDGERGGRDGKEGCWPGGRAAGAGSCGPHQPQGLAVTPIPVPGHPGKGKSLGKRREGGQWMGRNGHGAGMLISARSAKLNCQSFSFQ